MRQRDANGRRGDGREPIRALAIRGGRGRCGQRQEGAQRAGQDQGPAQLAPLDMMTRLETSKQQREQQTTDQQRLNDREGAEVQRRDLQDQSGDVAGDGRQPQPVCDGRADEPSYVTGTKTLRIRRLACTAVLQRARAGERNGRGQAERDHEPLIAHPAVPLCVFVASRDCMRVPAVVALPAFRPSACWRGTRHPDDAGQVRQRAPALSVVPAVLLI